MTYVFGSAFDPMTVAHSSIIVHICEHMEEDDKLVILVTDNDEKMYAELPANRVMMVYNWILHTKYKDKIHLDVQHTRVYDYVNEHQDLIPMDSTFVLGTDEWDALVEGRWEHSDEVMSYFNFLVISRDFGYVRPSYTPEKRVQFTMVPIPENASSTMARKFLYENPMYCVECAGYDGCIPACVKEIIAERRWYWQNPPTYYEEQEAFIKDYREVQIPKHHYPEPSNTVDNVAIYHDQVLLIRRKNFPYKNYWCLPGGFFDKTDDCLECSAARELGEETGVHIDPSKFTQVRTYSHIFDPRLRIIDTAFLVEVEQELHVQGLDDAADAAWFRLDSLPKLGFHHEQIIEDAKKIHYTIQTPEIMYH